MVDLCTSRARANIKQAVQMPATPDVATVTEVHDTRTTRIPNTTRIQTIAISLFSRANSDSSDGVSTQYHTSFRSPTNRL